MKKISLIVLSLVLVLSVLFSCKAPDNEIGGEDGANDNTPEDSKPVTKPDDGEKPSGGNKPDGEENSGSPFIGNDDLTTLCVLSSPSGQISSENTTDSVKITLTDSANSRQVVRVPVDVSWNTVKITQGNSVKYAKPYEKDGVKLIDFYMLPNTEAAVIIPEIKEDDKILESEFGMTLTNGTKIDVNYYPGFVRKSVTFTLDDGIYQYDRKVVDILKPYGFTGTFNINNPQTVTDPTIYDGFEVANHHILHAVAVKPAYAEREMVNEYLPKDADTTKVYLASKTVDGEKVDGMYYVYIGSSWHPMAADATYIKYLEWTTKELDKMFGENTVVGFAYPHGNQYNDAIIAYLKEAGYLYGRRTGNLKASTGFALPTDRYTWTYNADHNCLLEVMADYEKYEDDGNLKMFSFGVHAKDFETYDKWDDLETFAKTYGNRQSDFWYATNRQIFEYEDAIKSLVISEDKIVNNSDIAVFITVNNEKVIIPANTVYHLDGKVKVTVTFDADNGSEKQEEALDIGAFVTKPADPQRNGFTFDGWYVGDVKWNFNNRITESVTLTAKYTAEKFESASAEVLPVKGGAGGIVSIIHDDGRSPSGIILDELFLKYSLIGDVALLTNNVYNASTEKTKAEYDKWKAIIDTGRWGIISHSITHTWWGNVTKDADGNNVKWDRDDAKMNDEIVKSQAILRKLFPGHRVLTFAYPGFSAEKAGLTAKQYLEIIYDEESRALIDQYYISARNSAETAPAYVTAPSNWLYLDAFFLSPSKINGTGSGSLLNRLESAAKDGRIHMISMHAVSHEVEPGTTGYTLSSVDVETACRLIAEYVDSGKVWNAHYEDAILYVREAQSSKVSAKYENGKVYVTLTDEMDNAIYNYPLTVRVSVPGAWNAVKIIQNGNTHYAVAKYTDGKWCIDADIVPDGGIAEITEFSIDEIPKAPIETVIPTPTFDEVNYYENFESDKDYPTSNTETLKTGVVNLGGDIGKVYSIDKTATTYSEVKFSTASINNAEALVFSMKLYVDSESKRGGTIISRIHFASATTANAYLSGIFKANIGDGFCFGEFGVKGNNYSVTEALSYDTWHEIKLEIRIKGNGAFLAQYYVRESGGYRLIGESTNYGNGTEDQIPGNVDSVLFGLYSSGQPKMYIDNLSLKAGKTDYVGLPKIEEDDDTETPTPEIPAPEVPEVDKRLELDAIIDFETDPGVTAINNGTIEFVARDESRVLRVIDSSASAQGGCLIPISDTEKVVEAFSLTFDINVANATSFAATIFFADSPKTPYMLYIQASDGGYFLGDCMSNSGGSGTTTKNLTGNTSLSFNTWYTIRVDAVFTSDETFKAIWYVNGTKTGESTNRANYTKTDGAALQNTVDRFGISTLKGAVLDMKLDNIVMKAGDASVLGLDGTLTLLNLNFNANLDGVNNKKPDYVSTTLAKPQSATGTALCVEKYAKGTSPVVLSAGTSHAKASCFTFEFDINIASSNSGCLAQIFFNTGIASSPYDFTINTSENGYLFGSLTASSGGTHTNYDMELLEYGKTYHIKLHVIIGNSDTFLATLYVDGEMVGTSSAFYNPDKKVDYQPGTAVNAVNIYYQSAALALMYIDNVTLTAK